MVKNFFWNKKELSIADLHIIIVFIYDRNNNNLRMLVYIKCTSNPIAKRKSNDEKNIMLEETKNEGLLFSQVWLLYIHIF